MNTDTPVIEIQNLSRRYSKQDAVNGLSLKVRAGKSTAFSAATARARPRRLSACSICSALIPARRACSGLTLSATKSP